MSQSLKPTHFLSKVRTENYDTWLNGFVEHRPARQNAQLFEKFVLRNHNDPQECYVLFETLDSEKTKAFIDSAHLSEFKKSIGVIAKPEYTYLTLDQSADSKILERVHQAFTAVDRLDPKGFAEFFSEDGAFQFGNQKPIIGRSGIAQYVSDFFSMLTGLSHELKETSSKDNTAMVRGYVHYVLKDGRKVSVPFANSFQVDSESKFTVWQIYADVTPLFSAP